MNKIELMSNSGMIAELPHAQNRWTPVAGPETSALLEHLGISEEGKIALRDEAISVLAKCLPPTALSGRETGLVIGYVQSGKTMSFTTVAALAQDNGYQMVIVITGTSVNLFKQSTERLSSDLRLPGRDRRWKPFTSENLDVSAQRSIESALQRWRDASVLAPERQTILVTVMKNRTHLERLIQLLSQLDLGGVPAVIIDDEADQAGLNNLVGKNEESATYRRLVRLRACVPHHTFLQYTATPQALLLINLIDVLSPNFAEVLSAGSAYTGGIVFFERNLNLVRAIPAHDIPTADHALSEPPESLLQAMRVFFIGVAAYLLRPSSPHNRSMMVHPSFKTSPHADYFHWVDQVMRRWQATLIENEADPDRQELLAEFQEAYDDLVVTANDLPTFQELIKVLPRVIRETVPVEVNARPKSGRRGTPQVPWARDYAYIVVGGQALDRGVTIEGLTVTYMPRGRGVGNADTIQQRARWFGYKADYLGYCRVYLTDDTRRAYRSYVEHEEDVRHRLHDNSETGRLLRDWRRAFLLSSDLRPTRQSVIGFDYMRGNFANKWFEPRVPHCSPEAILENRCIVQQFLSSLSFQPDVGDPKRQEHQKHLVASDIPLREACERLLIPIRLTSPSDSPRFNGLLIQIGCYLEQNPDARCTVYLMSQGVIRERGVDDDDEILNLFQGAYPDNKGKIYPGDMKIRATQGLTIQIHYLSVGRGKSKDRTVIADNVPAVAVWMPREMSKDWLVQEQDENN